MKMYSHVGRAKTTYIKIWKTEQFRLEVWFKVSFYGKDWIPNRVMLFEASELLIFTLVFPNKNTTHPLPTEFKIHL